MAVQKELIVPFSDLNRVSICCSCCGALLTINMAESSHTVDLAALRPVLEGLTEEDVLDRSDEELRARLADVKAELEERTKANEPDAADRGASLQCGHCRSDFAEELVRLIDAYRSVYEGLHKCREVEVRIPID